MDSMELNSGEVNPKFWKGKKVFLTGHTGFKGSWLSIWLQNMGAKVKGYSLKPKSKPSLFNLANVEIGMDSQIGDIRDLKNLTLSIKSFKPEIVIHMAAQPLVRFSYDDPVETYTTNVIGTVNLLEAARDCQDIKSIVVVTTDKCYENKEWEWGYREDEPMGGFDPYSSSKGCAELVVSAYRRSYFSFENNAFLASARAGNVIGGGDWSEDRLIPDILNAFENSVPVVVRNPSSTRPWQHVMEPLSGYLILAERLFLHGNKYAEAWNFGPKDYDCKPVNWVLDEMIKQWPNDASWELEEGIINKHEAGFLKLDCSKASLRLGWEPKFTLKETIKLIIDWHLAYLKKMDLRDQCLNEINRYLEK